MAGLNRDLALQLKTRHDLHVFIETGTHKGQTALWACNYFRRVYTIEGLPERYHKTVLHWQTHYALECSNIDFYCGESGLMLAEILEQINEPALFWLDAHYCGTNDDERAAGLTVCPVLDEIAAINAHALAAHHVILIDDLRLFGVEKGWPTLDVVETALRGGVGREITAIGDILKVVPGGENGKH